METYKKIDKRLKMGIPFGITLFVIFIILVSSMTTISTGHKGVLYKTFGAGVDTTQIPLSEGFHFVAPWNKVFETIPIRNQNTQHKSFLFPFFCVKNYFYNYG